MAVFAIDCHPQSVRVLPTASIEYCTREAYKVNDSATIHLPNLSTSIGARAEWRGISVVFDNKFWVEAPRLDRIANGFRPEQSLFHAEVQYRIVKGVHIGIEHDCWHPLVSEKHKPDGIYGGKTGIYIKLN